MRYSVYIDDETLALLPYVRKDGEKFSNLVQRLIKENAAQRGWVVRTETIVEQLPQYCSRCGKEHVPSLHCGGCLDNPCTCRQLVMTAHKRR